MATSGAEALESGVAARVRAVSPAALLRLTPGGTAMVDRAFASLLMMERELLAQSLTDRQLEQTSSLLRRLAVSVRGD